ncbi:MAG: hypothetical protein ABII00_17645 [Elusimicrobiota bacterium]
MANKTKSQTSHSRITVGLPNLQGQIGMINRVAATASEPNLERWTDIKELLSDLYSQLQRQKQVTVYRLANKNQTKVRAD